MPDYQIELTDDADDDLAVLPLKEQKHVLLRIKEQLSFEPGKETRNRKRLRENPIATWELRIGKFRVFYEIEEGSKAVCVVAVGWKEHNKLFIRGKERNL